MHGNHAFQSPWLAQLKKERAFFVLEQDKKCDIAIIGAGIAGISTAYHALSHTKGSVLLIDAGRLAHGATGHNAGQVVSYFERPLTDIAAEFGAEKTAQAQSFVESAWGILEDILEKCKLHTPLYKCIGFSGMTTESQIRDHLEDSTFRKNTDLPFEPLLIKSDLPFLEDLQKEYGDLIMPVPHSVLLGRLRTDDTAFIAAGSSKKGCMNSALFCEELTAWMLLTYGDRFSVAENLPVRTVFLEADGAILETDGPVITTGKVVLCTNGIEGIDLINKAGEDIDKTFHDTVRGTIGYMAGFLQDEPDTPTAISYYKNLPNNAYHYLTRRVYERGDQKTMLLCMGGLERALPDRAEYDPTQYPFPSDIEEEIDRTFFNTYRDALDTEKTFLWHGLMGYTPDRIRRIGFEPRNPVLLYNLGCNGVGILPSIYGGKRLGMLLAGITLEPSIFDPK